jgi:hypothetical protein
MLMVVNAAEKKKIFRVALHQLRPHLESTRIALKTWAPISFLKLCTIIAPVLHDDLWPGLDMSTFTASKR